MIEHSFEPFSYYCRRQLGWWIIMGPEVKLNISRFIEPIKKKVGLEAWDIKNFQGNW